MAVALEKLESCPYQMKRVMCIHFDTIMECDGQLCHTISCSTCIGMLTCNENEMTSEKKTGNKSLHRCKNVHSIPKQLRIFDSQTPATEFALIKIEMNN